MSLQHLQTVKLKLGLKDTFDTLKQIDEHLMHPADISKEIEDSASIKDELFAAMAKDKSYVVVYATCC